MKLKSILHLGALVLSLACAPLAAQSNIPTTTKTIAINKAKELASSGKWGMVSADMVDAQIQDLVIEKSGEAHAYIIQTIGGIPVANGVMGLHFRGDGSLYYSTNRAIAHLQDHVKGDFALLNTSTLGTVALENGFESTNLPQNVQWIAMKVGTVFQEANYYEQTVAWPNADGDLIPTKYFVFYNAKTSDWVNLWIDANGQVLQKHSWTVHCRTQSLDRTSTAPLKSAISSNNSMLLGGGKSLNRRGDGATYKAFAYPVESPLYGNPSNLTSPADAQASPYGWHDVNGSEGAEYTITRGNNVYASEDADANNQPGYSPSGGSSLAFNFAYDRNEGDPVNYRDFAINNLFVANNLMHDLSEHYGFDEVSGNFQAKNYSASGSGGDVVNADAQDGSGTNNANFATPPEGSAPRMQMYIWDGVSVKANLVVNSTGTKYGVGITDGNWGKKITATPVTGKLVLVKDNIAAATNKCCTNLSNGTEVSGNIAAVVRGGCTFVQKVFRAQSYGATAVVLLDTSATDAVITMATDNTSQASKITIPVIFVRLSNANELRKLLADSSFNVTFYDSSAFAKKTDSDLDLGVMAHEYTHGISTRLTCGPSNSNGLSNAEQMGEGWSDFIGLAFTAKKGDVGSQSRGVGNWLFGQTATEDGIRTYPYSTNMTINPHTYANLAKAANGIQTEVHYSGEIWCAMLWDMYWEFVDKYGFDEDMYNGKGGNNMAVLLVIDAMKLQPCGPGFVDGRDAILMADENRNGGKNAGLIWKAFARRGLGYNAAQGSPNNCADGEENFELPPSTAGISNIETDFKWVKGHPNPAVSNYILEPLTVRNIETVRVINIQGQQQAIRVISLDGGGKSIDVSALSTGVYFVEVSAAGKVATLKMVKP